MKQYIRSHYQLGSNMKKLVLEGWDQIGKPTINRCVSSMVRRMEDVLAAEGKMTGW